MSFETEDDIYNHLYDPGIEGPRYSKETLCIWIRATIRSAIHQGFLLGEKKENDRVREIIKGAN